MRIILTAILGMLLVCHPAQAKYVASLNGPGVEVSRVFIHESGAISLYIAGDTVNLDECTSTFRVFIPQTVEGKEAMLSVALAALSSGRKIGIHGSGCGTTAFWGGTVDVPIVNNLWMF